MITACGSGRGPRSPGDTREEDPPPSLTVQLKGTCIHRGFAPLKNGCTLRSGRYGDLREGLKPLSLRFWGSVDGKPKGVSPQHTVDGGLPRATCRNKAAGNWQE